MIEILQGTSGGLQAIFAWLLVLYPVLTLPLLLGVWVGRGDEPGRNQPMPGRERDLRSPEQAWGLDPVDEPAPRRRRETPRQSRRELLPENYLVDAYDDFHDPDPVTPIQTLEVPDGVNLEQLLDVLEAANRIEDLQRPQARRQLREVATQSRSRRGPRRSREHRQMRTIRAAHRVAGNPRMQGWIRDVARDLLERTGSDS